LFKINIPRTAENAATSTVHSNVIGTKAGQLSKASSDVEWIVDDLHPILHRKTAYAAKKAANKNNQRQLV